MGVFLRWGVFGILAVAALVYVYNASKHVAEVRQVSAPAAQKPGSSDDPLLDDEAESSEDGDAAPEAAEDDSPACEEELRVAQAALQARRDVQPLDRLLRSQEIAFQPDPKRRQRLESVAGKWFEWRGDDPDAATLRSVVLKDCWRFSPAS